MTVPKARCIVFALAVFGAGPAAAAPDLRANVAMIVTASPQAGRVRVCAGVTAPRGEELLIWTARHCLTTSLQYVAFRDGTTVDGRDVAAFVAPGDRDIALLAIPARLVPSWYRVAPALRLATPHEGEPITVIGHPDGRTWSISHGTAATMALPSRISSFAVRCSDCERGDSGGAVFDGEGRVVGIIWGALETTEPSGAQRRYALVTPVTDYLTFAASSPEPAKEAAR